MRFDNPTERPASADSVLSLDDLGWQPWFAQHIPENVPSELGLARVAITFRDRVQLITIGGEITAMITGLERERGSLPAVGDWVLFNRGTGRSAATIHSVLPRRTWFSRKAPGEQSVEQIVAANIDTVFLIEPCDAFNARRLERALVAAWASGAQPVVVLSKADLCVDFKSARREAERAAQRVPVLIVSVVTGAGIGDVLEYCPSGQTIALIGRSGAGKSTLVNRLIGAEMLRTGEVRERDGRGRHTTTHRELLRIPGGGLIIDTPGLRELQLWDARDGFEQAFADIERLAVTCRFGDCEHDSERDCAVRRAIAQGRLDPNRLASFKKLVREVERFESKGDLRAQAAAKRRNRVIHRRFRDYHPRD